MFSSSSQPHGRLAVACKNRRASRCEPCSWLHQGDTYQLVISGLIGGKGVPESVRTHPRVFATLTAPSFGPVHRVVDPDKPGDRCRPRSAESVCGHGLSRGCWNRHGEDDPAVGAPLCPDCYDYQGAALWNGAASGLWDDFAKRVRRHIASTRGIPRTRLADHLRVSLLTVPRVAGGSRSCGDGPHEGSQHYASPQSIPCRVAGACGEVVSLVSAPSDVPPAG